MFPFACPVHESCAQQRQTHSLEQRRRSVTNAPGPTMSTEITLDMETWKYLSPQPIPANVPTTGEDSTVIAPWLAPDEPVSPLRVTLLSIVFSIFVSLHCMLEFHASNSRRRPQSLRSSARSALGRSVPSQILVPHVKPPHPQRRSILAVAAVTQAASPKGAP